MRALVTVALLVSSAAFAAGYGGAEGKNKRSEIVVFGEDALYVRKNKDVYEPSEEYKLSEECSNFHATFNGKKSFSCASEGVRNFVWWKSLVNFTVSSQVHGKSVGE